MDYKKNVSAQAIGRAIYVATGVAVYVFVARFLGPEILGNYAYAISVITVASTLADLSTTAILSRELVYQEHNQPEFITNYLVLRFGLAVIVGIAMVIFSMVAAPVAIRKPLMAASVLLPLISARFFDPIFQVANRPWLAFHLATASSAIWITSTYLGATIPAAPLFWTVIAYTVSAAAYGMVGLAMSCRLIRPRLEFIRWHSIRQIGRAAAPLAIGALFNLVSVRADVFLLAELRNTTEMGMYNAAFRFLDLGMAVVVTAMTPLLPILTRLAETNRQQLAQVFRSLTAFVATWCLLLAVVTPILSPLIIRLCYGEAYLAAADVLNLMVWRFFLAFINFLFLGLLTSLRTIDFFSWSSALAMVVNIGLNLLLIPPLGGVGAGWSGIASETSQVLVEVLILLRIGGSQFLSPRLWITLSLAGSISIGILQFLGDAEPGWLLLAATSSFILIIRLFGKLPESPLRYLATAKPGVS